MSSQNAFIMLYFSLTRNTMNNATPLQTERMRARVFMYKPCKKLECFNAITVQKAKPRAGAEFRQRVRNSIQTDTAMAISVQETGRSEQEMKFRIQRGHGARHLQMKNDRPETEKMVEKVYLPRLTQVQRNHIAAEPRADCGQCVRGNGQPISARRATAARQKAVAPRDRCEAPARGERRKRGGRERDRPGQRG
jgi:hypothetical protein